MQTRALLVDELELRTLAAADLAVAEPAPDSSEQVTVGPIAPQLPAVDPAAVDAVLTNDALAAAVILNAPPMTGQPTDQPVAAGSNQTNVNATTTLFASLNRTRTTLPIDAGANLQPTRDVVDEIINVDDARALLRRLRPRR